MSCHILAETRWFSKSKKGRKDGVELDGPKDDRSQDAVVVCKS